MTSTQLGSEVMPTSLVATVPSVRVSHRVDYGVRVMTTLAAAASTAPGRPVTSATLSETDEVPPGFLDDILRPLRIAGLLRSQRGGDGGWLLAKDAATITVADATAALEGPLASVRGICHTNSARQESVNRCVALDATAPAFDRCSNTSPSPTSPRASCRPTSPNWPTTPTPGIPTQQPTTPRNRGPPNRPERRPASTRHGTPKRS